METHTQVIVLQAYTGKYRVGSRHECHCSQVTPQRSHHERNLLNHDMLIKSYCVDTKSQILK